MATERDRERDDAVRREITASWLTSTLQATGQLPNGEVKALAVEHWRGKRMSNLYRLHATYTGDVDVPDRFVLKLSKPESRSSLARRRRWKEHEFYTQIAPAMENAPVPRHFAASISAGAWRALLLLEDLSATHSKPPSPLPPEADVLRGDIDCLASIHAAWWDHDELGGARAARDDAWVEAKAAATRRTISRFLAHVGDRLSPETRHALDAIGAAWPAILRRSTQFPLTVVHGDAHPWNFLTPIAARHGQTYLLDWEAWSIEAGPHDLASLIALHAPSETRNALEGELLDRYVDQLHRFGIADYDRSACHDDYRWSVARRTAAPVGMWSRGSQLSVWRPMLDRIIPAYYDLCCEELLAT